MKQKGGEMGMIDGETVIEELEEMTLEEIARSLIEKAYGATNLLYEIRNLLDEKLLFLDLDTGRRFLVTRCERRRQYVLQELLASDPKYYSFKAVHEVLK